MTHPTKSHIPEKTNLEHSAVQENPSSLMEFLEAIKFSHTVFALPFALIATLLAKEGALPTAWEAFWIVTAMMGARTWAMCVNRVADAHFDAQNPRTSTRSIPAGRLSAAKMMAYGFAGAVIFIGSAFALSLTAFLCSVPVLLILASYSYTKRFTWLCHYWLGLCLGLAPLGAWVALRNEISPSLVLLSLGICFWVSGFDILYALQDLKFDQNTKLHSIPSRFGVKKSLIFSRVSHAGAAICFLFFGLAFNLGFVYLLGLGIALSLMLYEHWLMRDGDLKNINMAFFNLNGWIAVLLLCVTALSLALA